MSDEKFGKYIKILSEQLGLDKKARRLAEVDDQLESYQGEMFLRLLIHEYSDSEVIGHDFVVGPKYSGRHLYSDSVVVETGVFSAVGYREGDFGLFTEDLRQWSWMCMRSGPELIDNFVSLSDASRSFTASDGDDGLLLWNEKLPVACMEGFSDELRSSSGRRIDAPGSLRYNSIESIVMLFGEEAVVDFFGFDRRECIDDTMDLYRAFLMREGLDPDKIISGSGSEELSGLTGVDRRDAVHRFVNGLRGISFGFFEQAIFDRYGVMRPWYYNGRFSF